MNNQEYYWFCCANIFTSCSMERARRDDAIQIQEKVNGPCSSCIEVPVTCDYRLVVAGRAKSWQPKDFLAKKNQNMRWKNGIITVNKPAFEFMIILIIFHSFPKGQRWVFEVDDGIMHAYIHNVMLTYKLCCKSFLYFLIHPRQAAYPLHILSGRSCGLYFSISLEHIYHKNCHWNKRKKNIKNI